MTRTPQVLLPTAIVPPRAQTSKWFRGAALVLIAVATAAEARTTEADLRRHIDYLASDALEGRKPGTAGEALTTQYIASQLAALGLEPAAPGGGWYQPVPLVERSMISSDLRWELDGRGVMLDPHGIALTGRDPQVRIDNAAVIFVGHGLGAETVDARGAIVLLLPGAPPGAVNPPAVSARREALFARGALAVLTIAREKDPWPQLRDQYRSGRSVLAGDMVGLVEGAMAQANWQLLATTAGEDATRLAEAAGASGFRPVRLPIRASIRVSTRVRNYHGFNVVGRFPGSDPAAGTIVHVAHHDHLGVCRPKGAKDRICNGAVDNASGVATLIEVARGLAASPRGPRDQLFVATTAEEMGLLGARAYVAELGEAKGQVAAAINYDTVAIAPKGEPVAIVGRGWTPALDAVVERTARQLRRGLDRSDAPNAFVSRQDGWEFLKAGIPAVMAGGSFSNINRLSDFLDGPYHKPEDDLGGPLILGGAAEDTNFAVALARELGDPDRYKPPTRQAAPSRAR